MPRAAKLTSALLFGLLTVTTFTTTAYAALSAMTANTIQGTKPYITFNGVVVTNLDDLLSFEIPNGVGGTMTITPTRNSPISADSSWTFSQFMTKVTADGVAKNLSTVAGVAYGDDDNDTPHATSSITGTLTATWSYQVPDGSGGLMTKTLTVTELADTFDACNAPYTLTIESNGAKVQSAYGDPIDNSYTDTTKVYTVNSSDYKICFAKPNQMNVKPENTWFDANGGSYTWNSGNPNRTILFGGGYSSDFDPLRGFKASAATNFPTTGFPGAEFDLVMSNAQSDYSYVSSQPSAVSVNALGRVLFNAKPVGAVTITATPTNPVYPAATYTFNPTTIWAFPIAGIRTWASSQTQCGGVARVLTRAQLTNSPYNNNTTAPAGWSYVPSGYTRAIGGGVFSEWGRSGGGLGGTYPSSEWVDTNYYWTQDVHTAGSIQFVVNSLVGYVGYDYTNTIYSYHYVACGI